MALFHREIETTVWEDTQWKFGNAVGKYADAELRNQILKQEILKVVDEKAPFGSRADDGRRHKRRRGDDEDGDDDDEEEEGEGDEGSEDELEVLRRKRLAELQANAQKPHFGRLFPILKEDYVEQVNEASKKAWVVLLMAEDDHDQCQYLRDLLNKVAAQKPETKFCVIRSTDAVPNFPRKQLPCVLIYKDGELAHNITGMNAWGGPKCSQPDIIYELVKRGALVKDEEDEE